MRRSVLAVGAAIGLAAAAPPTSPATSKRPTP